MNANENISKFGGHEFLVGTDTSQRHFHRQVSVIAEEDGITDDFSRNVGLQWGIAARKPIP